MSSTSPVPSEVPDDEGVHGPEACVKYGREGPDVNRGEDVSRYHVGTTPTGNYDRLTYLPKVGTVVSCAVGPVVAPGPLVGGNIQGPK